MALITLNSDSESTISPRTSKGNIDMKSIQNHPFRYLPQAQSVAELPSTRSSAAAVAAHSSSATHMPRSALASLIQLPLSSLAVMKN